MITLWTVYDKPNDFPDQFVARKFIIGATISATAEHVTGDTLDEVRAKIPAGLVRMPRYDDDEPHIVEVWL